MEGRDARASLTYSRDALHTRPSYDITDFSYFQFFCSSYGSKRWRFGSHSRKIGGVLVIKIKIVRVIPCDMAKVFF